MQNNKEQQCDLFDNCFDVIRVIASIIVVLSHSFRWYEIELPWWLFFFADGGTGVIVFFSISGYLTMASYEKNIKQKHNIISYYINRILRIYPIYIVYMLVITIVNLWIGVKIFSLDYLWYFCRNCLLPFGAAYTGGIENGALWTMRCTLWYYLLIPIVYHIMKKASTFLWIFVIFLFWMFNVFDSFFTLFIPSPCWIFFFYEVLIGAFFYIKRDKILYPIKKKKEVALLCWTGYTLLFYIYSNTNLIPHSGVMNTPLFGIIVPGITIILAYSFGKARIKIDISYGIYLYHMIFIQIILALFSPNNGFFILLTLIITIVISFFSSLIVEKPIYMLKRKIYCKNSKKLSSL